MTVRGGGIPRRPLALTPNGRMGPPLRSFAADAHDCIMVRVLGPTGYKVVARLNRVPKAGSPLIVIATALSVPSCSKPSRYGLARAKHAARLVRRPILTASARIDQRCAGRDEETDFEIKSRNRRRKKMRGPGKFLDKESAIQGTLIVRKVPGGFFATVAGLFSADCDLLATAAGRDGGRRGAACNSQLRASFLFIAYIQYVGISVCGRDSIGTLSVLVFGLFQRPHDRST